MQGFLERFLQGGLSGADPTRGRLRSLLAVSMRRWMKDVRVKDLAQRRGGDLPHVPLSGALESIVAGGESPDRTFERVWALAVVEQARERVGDRYQGREVLFQALAPVLYGDPLPPYAALAATLGQSEGSVAVAVCRLRQRFSTALRSVVAETVPPDEIEGELRWILTTLQGAP